MKNDLIPIDVYNKRRNQLRNNLIEKNLDAMLIVNPANRFYLSGFELHDGQCNETSGMLLITAHGDDWLATDSRYEVAASKLWNPDKIWIYKKGPGSIWELLKRYGFIIGIESGNISYSFFSNLKNHIPGLIPVKGLVEQLRLIKDAYELTALKNSFDLNHQLLEMVKNEIDNNFRGINKAAKTTELNLAWEIEKFFREKGASELAFPSIVAYGKNSALPHAHPDQINIDLNGPLLCDVGCRLNDYCSDQTRTWWLGDEDNKNQDFKKFQDTLKLVQEAQTCAIEVMKPGVPCAKVYETANSVFVKSGVSQYFTHGLGHGIGLETHEAPSLNPRSKDILQEGMTVTVEPGLYYSDWGGIRWEYTVVITENGTNVL